jgi:dihydroflavonol-4-reductase
LNVLVTGATGLVGANVAAALVAAGHTVRVLVRKTPPDLLSDLPLEVMPGDVCAPETLAPACDGCDAVVHAAAAVFVGETRQDWLHQVNVVGTENLCRAAMAAKIRRFVHVSSVDAIGSADDGTPADEDTPVSPDAPAYAYATTKREAEAVVRTWVGRGLHAPIVNPGYMFGPRDIRPSSGAMILEVARGRAWVAPPGGNDFVDVRDVARGILAALEVGRPGRRYILGGHHLTYREAWTRIARVVGVAPPRATAPAVLVRAIGQMSSWIGQLTGEEPDINVATAAAACGFHYFSSARAEAELGYRRSDIDTAIADAWADFQRRGLVR